MPRIEIFTGPNCGYCEAAKALMRENGLAFEEIDLAASPGNMEDFRARLPRVKSIPQIFADGDMSEGWRICASTSSTDRCGAEASLRRPHWTSYHNGGPPPEPGPEPERSRVRFDDPKRKLVLPYNPPDTALSAAFV